MAAKKDSAMMMGKATMAKMMKEYHKSGKIGRVTPRNEEHAKEIAKGIMMKQSDMMATPKKKKTNKPKRG